MNQMGEAFGVQELALQAMLGHLILRLQDEVTRLRALRGDGRSEAFAGLMMRDADIADLCQEMTGQVWGGAGAFRAAVPPGTTLARLVGLYELGPDEAALLVLAMAPALDPRFGRVYGFLQEDIAQQNLTPALAQRLLPGGGIASLRGTLSPKATLLRHGMLRLSGDRWITARVDLPDAVLDLILGAALVPDGVTRLPLPGQPDWSERPRLVHGGAQSCLVMGAGFAGLLWLCEEPDLARAQQAGVAAALAGASIAYSGWDTASLSERKALAYSLGRHGAILTARPDLWHGMATGFELIFCPPSRYSDRLTFWRGLCRDMAPEFPRILAESRLATPLLWRLAQEAAADADPALCLATMIGHHRASPMAGLADPVPCPHGFDDLILPEPAKARLKGFAARHVSAPQVLEAWGLGQSLSGRAGGIALFTGPSGVGKTMAAGVVARLAGLDLMRVNLATVVSKYIGETESNLERIFSAAAQSEVILFFDEAEALFSKRADVKDARDRYANMEMSYLLQRIESFHGTAILASNMGATLDPALLRRFDLVLDFALPDAKARRAIWEKLACSAVPLARDVNLDLLAERFDMAGGHIRQAVLTAAHEAAQGAGVVTQALLIQGVAREYVKLGRTLRREDFGAEYDRARAG